MNRYFFSFSVFPVSFFSFFFFFIFYFLPFFPFSVSVSFLSFYPFFVLLLYFVLRKLFEFQILFMISKCAHSFSNLFTFKKKFSPIQITTAAPQRPRERKEPDPCCMHRRAAETTPEPTQAHRAERRWIDAHPRVHRLRRVGDLCFIP